MYKEYKHQYIPGDYLMVCDSCGFTYRRSEIRKRWDGMYVCDADYEPRHPQEQVRVRVDRVRVPVARPDNDGSVTIGDAVVPNYLLDGGEIVMDGGNAVIDGVTYITTFITADDL